MRLCYTVDKNKAIKFSSDKYGEFIKEDINSSLFLKVRPPKVYKNATTFFDIMVISLKK